MLTKNPFSKVFRYIIVASVILLTLAAEDCGKILTTEADPVHGGIVLHDPDDGPRPQTPSDQEINQGNEVRIEAVPNPGFIFSHWEQTNLETAVVIFDMPSRDMTRTAIFVIDPAIAAGDPPAVFIASHAEGDQIPTGTVTFSGTAMDGVDGPLTGDSLVWISERSGVIGSGETITKGMGCGIDIITLTAANSAGLIGSASINVTLGTIPENPSTVFQCNKRPELTIESPAADAVFLTSDSITFTGSSHDLEDGILPGGSLVSSSQTDGDLGTGETITVSLSPGTQRIRLDALDSQGWNAFTANLTILVEQAGNFPPAATITSPAEGGTFLTSDVISLTGTGLDHEDNILTGTSLVWVSNLDGDHGAGESITASLSACSHVISFDVTDSGGGTVSEFVNITVEAAPTALIKVPAQDGIFQVGDSIAFSRSANDPEDGPLTNGSLIWTSHLDGQIGTGESFSVVSLSAGGTQHCIDRHGQPAGCGKRHCRYHRNPPQRAANGIHLHRVK